MALVKCPRCELNYILDGGELCTVCRKEVRGESEPSDLPELCSECGENPAVPGGELCLACLKEMNRHASMTNDDVILPDSASIGIDSVSTMDEIIPEIDEDIPSQEYGEIESELSLESVREEEDEDDEDEDEDEDDR